jgi:uncharacterized membrane protein
MTLHDLLKFVHVTGAIAWIGSGIGLLVLSRLLVRTREYSALEAVGRQSQSLGNVLFMPAAMLTVASGIALVLTESAYRFGELWILLGFGGIIASGAAQMGVAEPASKRFQEAVADEGTDQLVLTAAARRIALGNVLDVVLLLLVVWAMVAKPTL